MYLLYGIILPDTCDIGILGKVTVWASAKATVYHQLGVIRIAFWVLVSVGVRCTTVFRIKTYYILCLWGFCVSQLFAEHSGPVYFSHPRRNSRYLFTSMALYILSCVTPYRYALFILLSIFTISGLKKSCYNHYRLCDSMGLFEILFN